MQLLLLRHGIAVEPGTPGYARDSERPLTPEGRRKTRQIARALAQLKLRPEVILTSPYVRAHQTAEIIAVTLRRKKQLHLCAPLAGGGDPKQLIAAINRQHGDAESVMLVGHEPDLSQLASWLITGAADGAALELKKGGLCLLEAETLRAGRCARLRWLLPPRILLR
ncbi:MAG TPA: phosphohistidine phosphatase SixA [Verrucomicrobiae bacterium]|nr:phosphohistidine phosphatase SixA [Verrucomicrobiae bacterium]